MTSISWCLTHFLHVYVPGSRNTLFSFLRYTLCDDAMETRYVWTVLSTPTHTSPGTPYKDKGSVSRGTQGWKHLKRFAFYSLFWIHSSCNMISTCSPIEPAGILGQKLRLIDKKPYPEGLRHKVLCFSCCWTEWSWDTFGQTLASGLNNFQSPQIVHRQHAGKFLIIFVALYIY